MKRTPRCQMAVTHAEQSLSRFGHSHVSAAHLILGLMKLGNGIPYNLLTESGLTIQTLENFLSTRRASTEESTLQEGVRIGKSALSAFDRAGVEARKRNHTYLGTDHLLLGILADESGDAADLFESVHIDREKLRGIVEQELQ
jgi:ATP-dependent Clp protease ATP-binding subunit ClpC